MKQKKIVAIIGRPNVGKSTLFNRLVGSRLAIVNDMPGVTRDRIYHEIELDDGYRVNLMDTGGLEPSTDDYLLSEMKIQTVKAIEEADLVIMMVDGAEGMTAMDEEVAQMIRMSSKKVILAVNKADKKGAVHNVNDFYSFGFESMIPVSSTHGQGIWDLKQAVIKELELVEQVESDSDGAEDDLIHIAVIGKPNVGKSSLLNRIMGEDRVLVSDIPGTTRDSIDVELKHHGRRFKIIDTAGIRRKSKVKEFVEKVSVIQTQKNIERSDVVLMLVDSTDDPSLLDANIAGYAHNHYKNVIIVFNKWDLVEKETSTAKKFEAVLKQRMKFLKYAPVMFVSAKTGLRVMKLFDLIHSVLEESSQKVSTSKLNMFLEKAKKKHRAPAGKMGKFFKMYYITQTGVMPPSFRIFTNTEYKPHFSYSRYLENSIREEFGFKRGPVKLTFVKKPGKK